MFGRFAQAKECHGHADQYHQIRTDRRRHQVRIPRSELTPLAIDDIRQAQVVVVVGQNGKALTLNLKAPIVINLESRTGRQVVASGELPMQFELTSHQPTLKKSA